MPKKFGPTVGRPPITPRAEASFSPVCNDWEQRTRTPNSAYILLTNI